MNRSLRKQAFGIGLTGLAVTLLVIFSVVTRLRHESKVHQVEELQESLVTPLLEAKGNFRGLPQDADEALVKKEVITHLENAKTFLQNLYEGKESATGARLAEGAEPLLILVKLAVVEIDRTLSSIQSKSTVDFDKSTQEVQHVVDHFAAQEKSLHTQLQVLSWISIIAVILAFAAVTTWNYVSDKRNQSEASRIHEQLTTETKRVKTLSEFIEAMASGNYSIELASDKNDELSTTLVSMRDKLKSNAEEDQRRNWATSGLAQIGEILRSNSSSADLYDSIVKFVVKYTKSNQAGLFILNDDDSQNVYLELVACYAFERKKFLTKRVDLGQGLVGQCFMEKERIHLREVPQDYVRITSGLGGENPNSCLLVPLKVNEKIYGVLEMASFHLYQEYEIELVEKLAETIASTISSVRINESTRMLLERTQQQAEEMKSQEEEMRQNMEELSATQEEMQRKEREYIQRIEELEAKQTILSN